jgi:Leucine-rich repeat (LRR) protein
MRAVTVILQKGFIIMSFIPYTGKAPYTYISYSPDDIDAALQLAEFLSGHGTNVWLDIDNKPERRINKLENAYGFVALIGKGYLRSSNNVYAEITVFLNKRPDERFLAVFLDTVEQEIDNAAVNSGGIELLLKDGCDKFRIDDQLELSAAISKIYGVKAAIKRKRAVCKSLIAVACVIIILIAGFLFYNIQYPVVADTVGSYCEDSIFALEKLGFSIRREYEYSYDIPVNSIISQNHTGRLQRGSTINMTISLGAQAIPFEDVLSEALLQQGLDKNGDGIISQEEIATLQDLDLSGKGISSIYGLEYAAALKTLDISNNNIKDITVLSRLSYLKELDADNNSIVDISPLVGAEGLSVLYARNNQISDIKCLDFFKNLQAVYLSGNPIKETYPAMRFTTDLL